MSRPAQRGAAILAAILVVGIASAAAAGLLYSQSLWLHESTASADAARSRVAARAGIAWAAAILRQDARASSSDHPRELWATPLPWTQVEGAEIAGSIGDLQGRYNLNNLVRAGAPQPREIARYKRLLAVLGLPDGLADSVVDWMDTDSAPRGPEGAEDAYYLALPARYRTPGRALSDVHELLRVRGYTAALFIALRPYIAALPAPSAINVNTAPPETLLLVAQGWTLTDARLLAAARERSYFPNVADFRARLPQSAYPLDEDMVRTSSEFFSVHAQVRYGSANAQAEAIVQRLNPWPRVIWQRYDG